MTESRSIFRWMIPRAGGKSPPWGRPKLHRPCRAAPPFPLRRQTAGRVFRKLIRGEGRAGSPIPILRLLE